MSAASLPPIEHRLDQHELENRAAFEAMGVRVDGVANTANAAKQRAEQSPTTTEVDLKISNATKDIETKVSNSEAQRWSTRSAVVTTVVGALMATIAAIGYFSSTNNSRYEDLKSDMRSYQSAQQATNAQVISQLNEIRVVLAKQGPQKP